jgi:hypothetical protein
MKVAARVFAIALAFGVSGAPVVLDRCLMMCHEMAETASQGRAQTEHACHHTSDSSSAHRLHGGQNACDHDYGPAGTVASRAADTAKSAKSFHDSIPLVVFASLSELAVNAVGSPPSEQSPGSVFSSSLAVPLRI